MEQDALHTVNTRPRRQALGVIRLNLLDSGDRQVLKAVGGLSQENIRKTDYPQRKGSSIGSESLDCGRRQSGRNAGMSRQPVFHVPTLPSGTQNITQDMHHSNAWPTLGEYAGPRMHYDTGDLTWAS